MAKHTFVHSLNQSEGRFMAFNHEDIPPGEIVNTGSWVPALLLYRLPAGTKMTVVFSGWDQEPARHVLNNFMWSDTSGVTVMSVDGHEGEWNYPMETLGIVVNGGPKLAKRLKEVVRVSRYHTSSPAKIKWMSDWLVDQIGEKAVDGMTIISRSFARKMGLKAYHVRGNFRHLMAEGLIKGDAIIISDKQMVETHGARYDIVTPKVNLKTEINTTGWSFTTFNPHHAHNQAMFDVQSASWLREWLFPRDLMKKTLTTVIDTVLESLRNGEWPSWMIMAETQHLDNFGHALGEPEYAAEAFNRHYLRWQMHGMKPEHSASIMGMAANSFKSRLQSRLNIRDRNDAWKPMMWMPLPWAFYGHIMTHEMLDQAGYTIPEEYMTSLFYHAESGSVSIPGGEFAASFERHGTWDLDDSAKFFVRRDVNTGLVYCIIVRSPNSDGEYSYHTIGNLEDLPLYHTYGEIPEIDFKEAPAFIEEIMAEQHVKGLPARPATVTVGYDKDIAFNTFCVEETNPGIGGVANAMMVYYSSLKKSPERVLATMGDMVDCVQQTPYEAGFKAITEFTKGLWSEVMAYGMVDDYMALTRMPQRLRPSVTTYEGYFTSLFTHYRKEVKRYAELSRLIAFMTRQANPIEEINALSDLDLTTAAKWVNAAEKRFSRITKENSGHLSTMKNLRTELNRKVVRDMVTGLNKMSEDEADRLVLAMYRYCTIPGAETGTRFGRSDRSLFSPLTDGEETVMDIFIRALIKIGVAREVK